MWVVTEDYKSGTSSSVLDSGYRQVILISKENYDSVYSLPGEVLFLGHDFLDYLWNTEDKIKRLSERNGRNYLYCFERIRCFVPQWRDRSLASLERARRVMQTIFCTDEEDAKILGLEWLPQWGSDHFRRYARKLPVIPKILFHGQSGSVGYETRDALIDAILRSGALSDLFVIESKGRNLSWEEYVCYVTSYAGVLAPLGNFFGFNTRTFETINSNRILLQQVTNQTGWHNRLISNYPRKILFQSASDLENCVSNIEEMIGHVMQNPSLEFTNIHSFVDRLSYVHTIVSKA